MIKCKSCRKEKLEELFKNNDKIFLKCKSCRDQVKIWRKNNKERIRLYNELYRNNKIDEWGNIKKDNNIIDNVVGKPSKHRVLHEKRDNTAGKICCTCKKWQKLEDYNFDKTHWDKLRNECKDCLKKWRKDNRKKLNEKHKLYEKQRKKIDPNFKLLKILRSRMNSALSKIKDTKKCAHTLELVGCSTTFLKEYLEKQFQDGMSWANHGKWHVDHILPCCKFKLEDPDEQKKCFHYSNLQPLWAKDNLAKGGKIIKS
jgi:hypothetical protein